MASLKNKFFFSSVLTAVVVAAALGTFSSALMIRYLESNQALVVDGLIERVGENMVLRHRMKVQAFERVVHSDAVQEYGRTFREHLVVEVFTHNLDEFKHVSYLDEQGAEEIRVPRSADELQYYGSRIFFREGMRDKGKVGTLPVSDEMGSGQYDICYYVASYDYFDRFAGFLCANAPMSDFLGEVQSMGLPLPGYLTVLSTEGLPLANLLLGGASRLSGTIRESMFSLNVSESRKLFDLPEGVARASLVDIEGERFVLFKKALPELNWNLLLWIPHSEFMKPAAEIRNYALFVALFSLLVVMAWGHFISGRFDRQLQSLVSAMGAAAKGDFTSRAELASKDELGMLASSYNSMLDKIQGYERDLVAVNKYLGNLIAEMSDGLIALGPDLRIEMVNKAACRLLGAEESELYGRNVCQVLAAFSGCGRETIVREGWFRQDFHGLELKSAPSGTDPTWLSISGARLTDESSGLAGFICLAQDITPRKQSEKALRLDAERFRNMADKLPTPILEVGEGLEIGYANKSAVRIFNLPARVQRERLTVDFLACPEDKDRFRQTLRSAVEGESFGPLEVGMQALSGGKLTCLVNGVPLSGEHGKGVRISSQDISERKQEEREVLLAKEAAEAANKSKGEFLANMSHELRTPLNGIFGMLQLMQMTSLDEEQQEYIRTALSTGRSLLTLINDVLDFSKLEAGAQGLVESSFDLRRTVSQVLDNFRVPADEKGLLLAAVFHADVPRYIVADESRFRQVLFNLVGNAVKFTESGKVEVNVSPLPGVTISAKVTILLSVTDTGIGIPESQIENIFEAFTQVDGAHARRYKGTGLGLGIVRRLMELMAGEISVESTEGEGTTVYLTLPVAVGKEPSSADEVVFGLDKSSKPMRILVAEDDAVNRFTVEHFLSKMGHRITCVDHGEAAIKALTDGQFDCVLLDIQMPGTDGLEVTRLIRSGKAGIRSTIPIIAMSAHAMSGDRERILESGVDGYVPKPMSLDTLELALQQVME
ncbi:ATP-binding protein [Desulfovibrio ferrophilus]|uniref:ATP-binding protein n=1 Tax=Desulfovibrio ferrophilus TaxID=241368 RepID=UPI000F820509|nr:ATP-binding protein [Desulfovibrio ferrophilus]